MRGSVFPEGFDEVQPLWRIDQANTGQGLFSTRELPAGTRLVRFEGSVVALDQVPIFELNYVVRISRDAYMIPQAPARFINHACEPNCFIDENWFIVTRQRVRAGEELTISYNRVSHDELSQWGPYWHPAWTFSCRCQSPRCYKMIDGYVADEVLPHGSFGVGGA